MAYLKKQTNKEGFESVRISESKAIKYQKNPLVYTPLTEDKDSALLAHEYLWNNSGWLSEDHKRLVKGRWMGEVIGELVKATKWKKNLTGKIKPDNKGNAYDVFNRFIGRLATPEYVLPKEELKALEQLPESTTPSLKTIFNDYNAHRAETHIAPQFPNWGRRQSLGEGLIRELLTTETLMKPFTKKADKGKEVRKKGGKVPKEIYSAYRDGLSPKEIRRLSIKVIEIQDLIRWGDLWVRYLSQHKDGISNLNQVNLTHLESYPNWRARNMSKTKGRRPIAIDPLKKEVSYLKGVFTYAVAKDLVDYKKKILLDGYKIKNKNPDQETIDDKPLSIERMLELFAYCRKAYAEYPTENAKNLLYKKYLKQNYYALLFLAVTGCRPSEINSCSLNQDREMISILSGKTKKARRSIPVSPTLLQIIDDPEFQETMGDSKEDWKNFASRLDQWLERNGFNGNEIEDSITAYRFRHTVATIKMTLGELKSQEIAYEMGHTNSAFTETRYSDLNAYRGIKKKISNFWHWLTEFYFQQPERVSFGSGKGQGKSPRVDASQ